MDGLKEELGKLTNMTNWKYKNKDFSDMKDAPEGSIGFLYKITHKTTKKWYIGRRLFTKQVIKQINGKKKKLRVENDWKSYYSSNDELKEIAATTPDLLEREILLFVSTMGAMTLGEEYLLHVSGALFDEKSFNNNIRAKIFSSWFKNIPNFFNELKAIKL